MAKSSGNKPPMHLVADVGRDFDQPPRHEPWKDKLQRHGDLAPIRHKRTFPPVPMGGAEIVPFPVCRIRGVA